MKTLFLSGLFLFALPIFAQKARLMPPLSHALHVSAVALSPDGKYVLSVAGSSDNTVMMWSVESGKLVSILSGHKNPIREAAFSPNGNHIATLEKNTGELYLWDRNGVFLNRVSSRQFIESFCFTPGGDSLLLGNYPKGTLILKQLNGKFLKRFKGGTAAIKKISYAANGKMFASGDEEGVIRLYRQDGTMIDSIKGHNGTEIRSLSFSADARFILSTGSDGSAVFWNTQTRLPTKKLNEGGARVECGRISPDGKWIVGIDPNDPVCFIWSTATFKLTRFKAGAFGLNDAVFAPDSKSVYICGFDRSAKRFSLDGKLIHEFINEGSPVTNALFSPDMTHILTGSSGQNIRLWNLNNWKVTSFPLGKEFDAPTVFNPVNGNVIIGETGDKFYKVEIDTLDYKIEALAKGKSSGVAAIAFAPDGRSFLASDFVGGLQRYEAAGGKPVWPTPLKADSNYVTEIDFSPDGKLFLSAFNNQFSTTSVNAIEFGIHPSNSAGFPVRVHDASNGKVLKKYGTAVNTAVFSPNGKWIAGNDQFRLRIWDLQSDSLFFALDSLMVNYLAFAPDSKSILVGFADNAVHRYSLEPASFGKLITNFSGHLSSIRHVAFSTDPEGKYIITASNDNTTRVWDSNGKELVKLVSIGKEDWLVMTPNGLFDASPGAMKKLYVVTGLEVVELEQIKQRYYEPGLLQKVFSPDRINLRGADAFEDLDMFPEIVKCEITGDELRVQLKERSGHLGPLSLFVNGKEVNADINPEINGRRDTLVSENLKKYARYYSINKSDTIVIRAYNRDGWLKSPAVEKVYKYTGPALLGRGNGPDNGAIVPLTGTGSPALYAIIIGTSKYANPGISLNLPDADAAAMANAIRQTGKALFKEKTHVILLSTATNNPDSLSSKDNIVKAFRHVADSAQQQDIVLVYLAGHGTTYGQGEKSQFYYLTRAMKSEEVTDPSIWATDAISTEELTGWLTKIYARKQVMIIDACNSGKFTEAFTKTRSAVDPSRVVALDRMKDRTGMFILAGSAANQKSYESEEYGHGLLTYTLLQGINGAALRKNEYVDVMTLFQHARDEVPILARGDKGIQDPVPVFPEKGESFDIGIFNENVTIELAAPKPVFINCFFQDSLQFFDVLDLGEKINRRFKELTAKAGQQDFVFSPVNESETGYSIRGRYAVKEKAVKAYGKLFYGPKSVGSFAVEGTTDNYNDLVRKIMNAVLPLVNKENQ